MNGVSAQFAQLLRSRRSVRDFRRDPIPQSLLDAVLDDARQSPSWSNTQPYRIAIASGPLRDQLASELCMRFDLAMRAQSQGLIGKLKLLLGGKGRPDGDLNTFFDYPSDLETQRRDTGFGLYRLLGISREDKAARHAQMRRNFDFFGAPVAIFLFAHRQLREFSVLDAGIYLQSLMLSAQAHGLASCAQGALATWAGPIRDAFVVPPAYRLICGVSLGFASEHPVNQYNPGRQATQPLAAK